MYPAAPQQNPEFYTHPEVPAYGSEHENVLPNSAGMELKNEEPLFGNREVIATLKGDVLRNGMEIDRETWERLLGSDCSHMLETMLVNPGDTAVVKGSTVLKLVLGGFSFSPDSNQIPTERKPDVDVVVQTSSSLSRLASAGYVLDSGRVATKTRLEDGTEVGLVQFEKLKDLSVRSIHELLANLDAIQDVEYRDYVQWLLMQQLDMYSNVSTVAHLLSLNNFLPYEELSLRFDVDDQNSLNCHFEDPMDFLGEECQGLFVAPVGQQIQRQLEHGVMPQISYSAPNLYSSQYVFMMYFQGLLQDRLDINLPTELKLDEKTAQYTLNVLPRMIVAACEHNIEPAVVPGAMMYRQQMYFGDLVGLSAALTSGELQLALGGMSVQETQKWFSGAVQEAFVRGCGSNMESAYNYVFAYLPLGKTILPKLGEFFSDYYPHIRYPNNYVGLLLSESGYKLPLEVNTGMGETYTIPDCPQTRSMCRFYKLIGLNYGSVALEGVPYCSSGDRQAIYYDYSTHPKDMSEVMGAVLSSVGWDPEANDSDIRELVSNWQPRGNLTATWRISSEPFDKGLDVEDIKKHLRRFNAQVAELDL